MNLDNEIWLPVVGYEGLYQVSNYGRVKSLERKVINRTNLVPERIMKLGTKRSGYKQVELQNQSSKFYVVHRLVAQAFIPNPENKPCIDHINNDPTDNRVENLQWCTYSENNKYTHERGRANVIIPNLKGQDHANAKFTHEQVKQLRSMPYPNWNKCIELGRHFNVDATTISNLVRYKTYKNA